MDFSANSIANPTRLIHFFADNVQAGGQGEFADGSVALIRLYDIDLTPEEVETLTPPTVPEPTTLVLLGLAVAECRYKGLKRLNDPRASL